MTFILQALAIELIAPADIVDAVVVVTVVVVTVAVVVVTMVLFCICHLYNYYVNSIVM